MAFISKSPKSNNFIGDSNWQDVTQKWRFIEAIAKGGLDFKVDEYLLTSKLLKYQKPSYAIKPKYVPPVNSYINIPETTMTSI
tara:strand:- start:1188 stop:1436 length:249 start_codon:yes stop_codon:yes gene_type:complete